MRKHIGNIPNIAYTKSTSCLQLYIKIAYIYILDEEWDGILLLELFIFRTSVSPHKFVFADSCDINSTCVMAFLLQDGHSSELYLEDLRRSCDVLRHRKRSFLDSDRLHLAGWVSVIDVCINNLVLFRRLFCLSNLTKKICHRNWDDKGEMWQKCTCNLQITFYLATHNVNEVICILQTIS